MYLLWFKGTIQTLLTEWVGWGFFITNTCSTALYVHSRIGNTPISFKWILLLKNVRAPLLGQVVSEYYNFVFEKLTDFSDKHLKQFGLSV